MPASVDEIQARCGLALPALLARLAELELGEAVRPAAGGPLREELIAAAILVRRMAPRVTIVGGGLAGCEAAWQLARRGVEVDLFEMRPSRQTPVHQTGDLAELVCSNSLRGNALDQAAGLLKEEMRRLGSLVVRVADAVKVPAGSALAVDRGLFARRMTEAVESLPRVEDPPPRGPPDPRRPAHHRGDRPPHLGPARRTTSPPSWAETHLHFFDAVSPVVEADSIDLAKAFRASRYGKGGDDYLNCPLDEAEYRAFLQALTDAECASAPRLREGALLRGLPARRGDRLAGGGHAALRADEAGRPRATRAPGGGPTPSCSCGRTTSRPATGRWSASRPSSSGATRSGSSA